MVVHRESCRRFSGMTANDIRIQIARKKSACARLIKGHTDKIRDKLAPDLVSNTSESALIQAMIEYEVTGVQNVAPDADN